MGAEDVDVEGEGEERGGIRTYLKRVASVARSSVSAEVSILRWRRGMRVFSSVGYIGRMVERRSCMNAFISLFSIA